MTAHISNDETNREETVAEHTEKTVFLCKEKGKRCGLSQVMQLCGVVHDMGKCKRSFEEYIHAEQSEKQKLRGSIAHASTGAKWIYDRYHESDGSRKVMAEMISYAVAAHHGLFDCVTIEHLDAFSRKMIEVEDYSEARNNAEKDYLNMYEPDNIFIGAADEFDAVWKKLKNLFEQLKPLIVSKNSSNVKGALCVCRTFLFSCLQRLILSILIDSDWESTSDFMCNTDTLSKQSVFDTTEIFEKAKDNFETYMRGKQQAALNFELSDKEQAIFDARNILQEECRQFAKYPAGIYCLPIPTGGGKTLSGLAYALEFCRRYPETERIIYVSPYISITEQNAQVFREAVGNDSWMLEHHSALFREESEEREDYRNGGFARYDINWEEPFICTTFVQFINTLFSDKSESIRRMHRLVNAVVIIDEVQSMPLKCVHTFNYMLNFLNAVCNTNIVLCTATQPTLEETECPVCYGNPRYMIENAAQWFYRFERVKINTPGLGQKYTFESLGDDIAERTKEFRSILVVLNTKSAVRKLYDILKVRHIHTEYLTTNLCAQHRSDRLKSIRKKLKEKQENIVVVSTNLIEAGVDISFECVYRSMAGLDSLAQTAGRCNRDGEMKSGTIYLINLEGENTGNMEELQQNIRVTESVIGLYGDSKKTDSLLMQRWMEEYYKRIYSGAADKMNFPIKKLDTSILELLSKGFTPQKKRNFMNQAYKTAGQAYRVIDDDSFGVIVPYGKGSEMIEAIQKTSDMSDVKKYVRQAQRYTVNIRSSMLKKFDGLIQPVSDKVSALYMVAAPGAYSSEYGITPEWETLIF